MNFLSRRNPGDDRRDGPGGARPRHRPDAQELRSERGQGQADRASRSARRWAVSTPTLDFAALADCDLIIEAVYENMDVKKEVFGRLDKIAKPGAILASNTSYLNIDEIAASISRPGDVVGMHFFSPANIMKLLEVVRGAKTAPDVLLTAMQHRQEDQEGAGRRGRVPRLHRQPHADAAPDRGDQAAAGRRDARAGRPRPCRVRNADGPVPDGRPRRGRHRLAPRPQPHREYPRRAVRDRPLGPEEGRRLLRL